MSDRSRTYAACLAALLSSSTLGACSKLSTSKSASTDTAPATPTPPAPAPGSQEKENAPADEPAQVSGAFLYCAVLDDATLATSGETPSADDAVVGCVIKDHDGKRLDEVQTNNISVSLNHAAGEKSALEKISPPPGTPWHFFTKIGKGEIGNLRQIIVEFLGAYAKKYGFASTTTTDFDYEHDPLFTDTQNIASAIAYDRFGDQINEIPYDVTPLAAVPADARHLLFVTQKVYPPNFGGIAGADAICAEAGKALEPARTWLAILSDSTTNARDHVVIAGPVYNVMAGLIAKTTDELFSTTKKDKQATVRWTEKGYDVESYLIKSVRIRINHTWSGTTSEGAYDATKGACKDWTSADFADRAAFGYAEERDSSWISAIAEPDTCATWNRLYCISQ